MIVDIEESEEMNASQLHTRRLNTKELLTPMKGIPVSDRTVKTSGGHQHLRTSTFIRDHPERGKEHKKFFEENQTDSLLQHLFKTTQHATMRKLISFIVITWNPESYCTCREKNHFLFRRSIDVTRTTKTSLDALLEKHIDDNLNVDGRRELSDAQTGFTRFILLNERPPDGLHGLGGELRGNTHPQNPTMYGQICGSIRLMQRKAKRSKTGLSRKQSSIMPNN